MATKTNPQMAPAVKILVRPDNGYERVYTYAEDGQGVTRRTRAKAGDAWSMPQSAFERLPFNTVYQFVGFISRNYTVLGITRYHWCDRCESRVNDSHERLFHGEES